MKYLVLHLRGFFVVFSMFFCSMLFGQGQSVPANDECSSAIPLAVNTDNSCRITHLGDVLGATQSRPICAFTGITARDVWFKFVATATTQRITVTQVDYNLVGFAFEVFSGNCTNLASFGCTLNGPLGYPGVMVLPNLTIGNTYYIRFYPLRDGTSVGASIFSICINLVTPPYVVGGGCPRDTLVNISSSYATESVTWPVPRDSFPASISIPSGVYPDGTPYYGEGRLTLLGAYGGHGYYRSSDAYQSYNWTQANSIANSVGGHLTTITSQGENAFVLSQVQSTGYFSWIGLQRTGTGPAQFSWVTGEPLVYTNWGPEDPNNGGGHNTTITEPYAFMYEGSGKWHDLPDLRLPFQVEFDQASISRRQISGPLNGSSLPAGVYPVCYERFNPTTNKRDTCCFTVTVRFVGYNNSTTEAGAAEEARAAGFRVKVLPNPFANSFTLQLNSSNNKERISIRVMDISGRVIEARTSVAPNSVLQLGSGYTAGTYLVEVLQGTKRTTLKVMKQAR
jgi:hypothetical protein